MTTKRTPAVSTAPAKPAPSRDVADAIAAADRRVAGRPIRPSFAVDYPEPGKFSMSVPHADHDGEMMRLADTLGTASGEFAFAQIGMIVNALRRSDSPVDANAFNSALAFLGGVDAENEVEAALGVQMYATHVLAMDMLGRARRTDSPEFMQVYGNLATKLTRTFTGQIEALAKLRRGGEQVVRHIHVDNRGGQAIIAENVQAGGSRNNDDQSHGPSAAIAECAAMLGHDPAGNGVPVPGDTGQEPVSASRRPSRRTAR